MAAAISHGSWLSRYHVSPEIIFPPSDHSTQQRPKTGPFSLQKSVPTHGLLGT